MEENQKEVEVVNNTNVAEDKKGKSIASMVLGIVSIIAFCINSWVALICAILGLIFGILGKKNENAQGMAKTGIILSVISIAIMVILIVALVVIFMLGFGTTILYSI